MKFSRPWVVAGATFAALVTVAGVRSAQTMLILPLEGQFGFSAEPIISAAIALNILLFGLTGPFAAALYERYGVRRTVGVALGLIGIASAATVAITAPWQLIVLWGVIIGTGIGTISLTLGATIATRWFETNRGVVMGVFAAGNATGQLIFLPLFARIIEHSGWRACALALAAACVLVAPIFLGLVRDRPAGTPVAPPEGNPFTRAIDSLKGAARSRDFWLLAGTFAICGASTNGLIGTHLVPACGDHGIPETRAATLLATMGVFDLAGTTLSGWLSDRFSNRGLLFWYYGLRGISLIFLPYAFGWQALGLPIFSVFYGLDWIATVPPTLRLTTNAFGAGRAPLIFGWVVASHQVGASIAAFAAGLVRVEAGSYDAAFLTSGVLCLAASLLVLQIGRGRRPLPAQAMA